MGNNFTSTATEMRAIAAKHHAKVSRIERIGKMTV